MAGEGGIRNYVAFPFAFPCSYPFLSQPIQITHPAEGWGLVGGDGAHGSAGLQSKLNAVYSVPVEHQQDSAADDRPGNPGTCLPS